PAGDETEYLVVTQSLLLDHDLKNDNNYRRGDYREYTPNATHAWGDAVVLGTDGEIYSQHLPALPALIAPAFALGGYFALKLFLAPLSAAAGAPLSHST